MHAVPDQGRRPSAHVRQDHGTDRRRYDQPAQALPQDRLHLATHRYVRLPPPISFLLFVLLTAGAFATAELLGGINAAPPPELMEEEEEDDEAEEEVEETSKSNENKKRKEPPQSPQQAKKAKAKATAGSKKGAAGNVPRPTKKHREGK